MRHRFRRIEGPALCGFSELFEGSPPAPVVGEGFFSTLFARLRRRRRPLTTRQRAAVSHFGGAQDAQAAQLTAQRKTTPRSSFYSTYVGASLVIINPPRVASTRINRPERVVVHGGRKQVPAGGMGTQVNYINPLSVDVYVGGRKQTFEPVEMVQIFDAVKE